MRIAIVGLLTATALLAASYEPFPAGFREWMDFDDHAMIAYELLEPREASGVVSEGPRLLGESQTNRAVSDRGAKCFSRHEKQKARGYVFSRIRE